MITSFFQFSLLWKCSSFGYFWLLFLLLLLKLVFWCIIKHTCVCMCVCVCVISFEPLPSFSQFGDKWQGSKNNQIPKGFKETVTKLKSVIALYELKPAAWSSTVSSTRDLKLKRCQTEMKGRREKRPFLYSNHRKFWVRVCTFFKTKPGTQDKTGNETPVLTELCCYTVNAWGNAQSSITTSFFLSLFNHLLWWGHLRVQVDMTHTGGRAMGGSRNQETKCDNSANCLGLGTYVL